MHPRARPVSQARLQQRAPYAIAVPSPTADALVSYGGFPGLRDDESLLPTKEIAFLTEGLLEI
jgi:hypothetical protein